MPPVSQQGSRAGLLTGLVISAVLAVAFICTTIYYSSKNNEALQQKAELQKQLDDVATANELSGSEIGDLRTLRSTFTPTPPSLLATALRERDELARKIYPSAKGYADALKIANAATNNYVDDLKKNADVTVDPAAGLWPLVQNLVKALEDKQSQLQTAQKAAADAQTALTNAIAANKKAQDENAAALAKVTQQAADAKTAYDAQLKEKDTAVDTVNQKATATVADNGAQLQKYVTDLQARQADVAKLQKQIDVLKHLIAARHIDPKDPIIRQPDGRVIKVADQKDVYIDLGSIDKGVSPGLTFEVYDRVNGVPGIGAETDPVSNDNLPVGKASIEIIRVGQNSSEARVTRIKPGETITEGDVIANLVYDRNATYNFFVYGDFDPDQSGVWTAAKADVIKSLVRRWGGTVVNHITPDTDFVVVGREPQLPNFSKEDLEQPENRKIYDIANDALKQYNEVVNQAKELTIPILNQNRFLYYTGYYDLAKR